MIITDIDQRIQTFMHYSDPRAGREIDVFGKEETGLHYDYSDRLYEWDYKKAQESWEKAG